MTIFKKIIINKIYIIFYFILVGVSSVKSDENNIYSETKGFVEGQGYIETIGIPTPPYDVEQEAPNIDEGTWIKPQEGLYYINASASNASDSTNGTPLLPRKTIPSLLNKGSYVKVEGEYAITSSSFTFIKAEGDDQVWEKGVSGPVWVVGKNAVFSKNVLIEGSNLFVDTIQFGLKNGEGGSFLIGSSKPRLAKNIVIRNSEFYGKKTTGTKGGALVYTGVNETTPAQNIFIFDNKFYSNGDVDANFDEDSHMIQVEKGVNGYWFINNLIQYSSGSGIQIIGSTDSTKNIYIGSNTISDVRQSGIGMKYGTDIIISQNVIKNIIDTRPLYSVSPSPSKGISYQYETQNLWLMFNDISGSSFGVYGGSDTGSIEGHIYVVGNYIHDIKTPDGITPGGGAWADSAIMMMGGKYRYIINNTIRNVNAGIYGPSNSQTMYNISQNIIYRVTNGNHIYVEAGASAYFKNQDGDGSGLSSSIDGTVTDEDNNIIWAEHSGSLQTLKVDNICAYKNCFYSDEIFINEDTSFLDGGAQVQSDKNGHDRGTKHYVYTLFSNLYNLNIDYDIYGAKRTSLWDIGSVEDETARSGLNITLPAKPTIIDLIIK